MCYNIINVGVGSLAVVGSTTYLLAPTPSVDSAGGGLHIIMGCYSITQMDKWKLIPRQRTLHAWLLL